MIKQLYDAVKENTTSLLMTILIGGACLVYNDFREYTNDAMMYQRQQIEKQLELNAQFVESLNKINTRLDMIERNIEK